MQADGRPPDGGRRTRGRSGELRPAASKAHARRLPHARLRGRRRGRGAGGLHPLDGGRPQRGARARGVPAPHGHAALPRSAQIGAAPARDLYRPLASRSRRRRGRGRGRRHLAADAGAGAPFAARAGGLPAARRVRAGIRGGRRDHPARPGGLPPARRPRAQPCPRGAAALPGGKAARPRACRGLLRRLAQRRHGGARRDAGGRCQLSMPTAAASGRQPWRRSWASMPS